MAAVVALVAAGALVAAVGAGSLHVAVGQEPVAAGAVGQQHGVGVDVVLLQEALEDALHHPLVVLGVGGGEEVEGDAQALPRIEELGVVAVQDDLGIDALLVGADGDGGAVGIGAGHHQDLVAFHAVVAGEDIGCQIAAGDVAHVERAVCIGPGNTDENTLGQDQSSSAVRRDRDKFGNSSTT